MGGLSVCPDGANALFSMPNKETKAINIWRLDLQSGAATALTKGKVDQNASCSPDSKSFLYTSFDKGKKLLMEMPLSGGEAKQLSNKVADFGVFSPDGQQIAALTTEGTGVNFKAMIAIIPAQGGLPVKSFPPVRCHLQFLPVLGGRAGAVLSGHDERRFQYRDAADRRQDRNADDQLQRPARFTATTTIGRTSGWR